MPARQFRHERHTRFLHALFHFPRTPRLDVQRRGTVHRLARFTRRQDGQRSIPVRRQHQHRIDVVAHVKARKPSTARRAKFLRHLLRARRHFRAHGPHFKSIAQRQERSAMPHLPSMTQPDNAYTQFHPASYPANHHRPVAERPATSGDARSASGSAAHGVGGIISTTPTNSICPSPPKGDAFRGFPQNDRQLPAGSLTDCPSFHIFGNLHPQEKENYA